MKVLLSSSLDSSEGEEAMINDRLCWLEVSSWSLSSLQRLENVRQFSYSCLCFPSTRFLLDLTQRIRGSEIHAPCPLCSELSGQLFCYVCLDCLCVMPLVLEHLKFPVSSNAPCICDQLPPPCSSSQGIPGFMERNQAGTFFFLHMLGNSVFLGIVFLMSCFFPNVSYLVLRLFCS